MCAHPVDNCTAGKPGECNPLEGAGAETCNALDDDCDGGTDEDHANTCCLNGILTAAEECDDGNQVGNDGCSLICTLPGCRGLQLDGKDDKVVISPDPTLESPNAFTWEVWVYFTGHRDGDAQSIIADYGQDGYGCGL